MSRKPLWRLLSLPAKVSPSKNLSGTVSPTVIGGAFSVCEPELVLKRQRRKKNPQIPKNLGINSRFVWNTEE